MHAHAACSCLGTALSQPRACGCQTQMKRTAYSIYCSIDVHVYSGIYYIGHCIWVLAGECRGARPERDVASWRPQLARAASLSSLSLPYISHKRISMLLTDVCMNQATTQKQHTQDWLAHHEQV